MEGWVSLHRQIMEHWTYQEKRVFSKFEAWIDLILMANHKDARFPLGTEIIQASRGDVITSEVKLMERWRWGKSKTRSFLEVLEKDGMIVKKSDRKKTTITIVNFGTYQPLQTENRLPADREQTASRPPADTINNVNNVNNDNKLNKKDIVPFSEIVDHLNLKTGSHFRHSSKTTKKHIQARWNEGHRIDDFKTVIETKVAEWLDDAKMSQYLCPETLFGSKFEKYLNQKGGQQNEAYRRGVQSGRTQTKNYNPSLSDAELDELQLQPDFISMRDMPGYGNH